MMKNSNAKQNHHDAMDKKGKCCEKDIGFELKERPRNHLVVFSPHHDDAYWQTSGVTIFLQRQGWKVTYITVIGDHYRWGGKKNNYRKRAIEAAKKFNDVGHILLDHKTLQVQGPDPAMAEEFCELIKSLSPAIVITQYPVSLHPDHYAVAVNSLRACTSSWFGVERRTPDEVWCYQAYNPDAVFDFSIDISSVADQVKERTCFWREFGPEEFNSLWQNRKVENGLRERFYVAKANQESFTIAGKLFPEYIRYETKRIPASLVFG